MIQENISDLTANPISSQADRSSVRQQAFAIYAGGKLAQALATAEQALADSPSDVTLLNLSAICHARLGSAEQALSCWQQALCIRPEYAEVHNNIGTLLKELK